MIIVCQNCASRLQLDDAKSPARPFTIRCPKCNNLIESSATSPALEKSGLAVGGSPATGDRRYDRPTPAPLFECESNSVEAVSAPAGTDQLLQLLTTLMARKQVTDAEPQNQRPAWDPRKVLVCTPETNRENIARQLVENGYQVFLACETRQAVERMREDQLDVVLLDPQFDQGEQGAAFVVREVNVLRPAQRRRLFFVLLSPSLRTMDAHAAFLNNVNVIVNLADIADLPNILDQALREYNDLYKELNATLKLAAL